MSTPAGTKADPHSEVWARLTAARGKLGVFAAEINVRHCSSGCQSRTQVKLAEAVCHNNDNESREGQAKGARNPTSSSATRSRRVLLWRYLNCREICRSMSTAKGKSERGSSPAQTEIQTIRRARGTVRQVCMQRGRRVPGTRARLDTPIF